MDSLKLVSVCHKAGRSVNLLPKNQLMKIVGVFILAVFFLLPVSAQKSNDKKVIDELKKVTGQLNLLKDSNEELQKTVASQKDQIEQLNEQLTDVRTDLVNASSSADRSFTAASLERGKINDRVEEIGSSITRNTVLFTLFGLALVLSGFGGFLYLKKRMADFPMPSAVDIGNGKLSRDVAARLADSNSRDSELLDVLTNTFSLLQEKAKNEGPSSEYVDHKLALKVGDEIHRMRKRIEYMPQEIKGLGALKNSLNRLEEEFNESGYQMHDLLGKQYNDGMRLEARFVDDPSIPKGSEIITDVLRPQIAYKDKVIQFAKVEVGKSY